MRLCRRKAAVHILTIFFLSIYITFVVLFNPNSLYEATLSQEMPLMRYGMISCCLVSLVIWCVLYLGIRHRNWKFVPKVICAVAFAVIQTISLDFYYFHSFLQTLKRPGVICYNLLCVVSYGILFFCIESVCFMLLDHVLSADQLLKKVPLFWEKHIGKISFIIIMICWLPWLIVFYPGSMWFDMCYQIEQYYFGNYHLHPIFVTLCMGACLDIGKYIFGSDNIGVFIYIFLQSVICAFAFSRVINLLKKLKVPQIIWILTVAYYGLSPIVGAYMQIGTKDVLSCGLFVLFTVQTVTICAKIYGHKQRMSVMEVIELLVTSALCSLYRKELIAVCAVVLTVLIIMCLKERFIRLLAGITSALAGMILIYIAFDAVVVKLFLGSSFNGGSTEALSIPLQQIARVVYYEGDQIEEDEREILNQCFTYGYDGIAGHYNPYLSDGIKYSVGNTEGLGEVWLSLLFKKPLTYVEATWANSFGYYSVIPPLPSTINGAPTNGTPGSRFEFYINRDPDLDNQMVVVSYLPFFKEWRKRLTAYAYDLRKVPVINLLYSLGFYTWGGVIVALYGCGNKRNVKYLIAFLPFILGIGVCVASPVNDCLRYFLPVIANLPIMVGWALSIRQLHNGAGTEIG